MSDMPETAKELIKDAKLFEESLIALHQVVLKFDIELKTRITKGGVDTKKLIKILRGGILSRPSRWIRDISRINQEIPTKVKKLAAAMPSKSDMWYKLHQKAITSLNMYLVGNRNNLTIYVNSIVANLPARVTKGNFVKFLESTKDANLSQKGWDHFSTEVHEMLNEVTALVAISKEIRKKAEFLTV